MNQAGNTQRFDFLLDRFQGSQVNIRRNDVRSAPGKPKRYVQDAMRERAADLLPLLSDPNAFFFVCGLKAMEEGVVLALRDIAQDARLDWDSLAAALKREGRLQLETY